jgi:hypothetical protein
MHAWIVVSLCVAGMGAAPASVRNQPRPQMAKPLPHGVIAAVFSMPSSVRPASKAKGVLSLVPPAPLPEREEEAVVVAALPPRPESCKDSTDYPPAPPAESGHCKSAACPPDQSLGTIIGTIQSGKVRLFSNDSQSDAFPPPIVQKLGAEAFEILSDDEPQPIPDVMTPERLHHIQAAIGHLEAAGLLQAAQQLREQAQAAAAQLRQERFRVLREKEAERERLTVEIEELKAELTSAASIEFRIEHFVVNSALLHYVMRGGHAELRTAARILSTNLNPTPRITAQLAPAVSHRPKDDMSLAVALQVLRQTGVIQLRSAPKLLTRNGETVHLVVGSDADGGHQRDGSRHSTHTNLEVHAPLILPDGRIQAEVNYEIATEEKVAAASHRKVPPSGDNMKIVNHVQLTSGQTTILGGISTNGTSTAKGDAVNRRRTEVITITATLKDADALPPIPPVADNADWIDAADADECEAESFPIQPSSSAAPSPMPTQAGIPWWRFPFQPTAVPSTPHYEPVPVLLNAPVFQLIPSPGTGNRMRVLVPMTPNWSPAAAPPQPEPVEADHHLPPAPIPERTDADDDEEKPPVA